MVKYLKICNQDMKETASEAISYNQFMFKKLKEIFTCMMSWLVQCCKNSMVELSKKGSLSNKLKINAKKWLYEKLWLFVIDVKMILLHLKLWITLMMNYTFANVSLEHSKELNLLMHKVVNLKQIVILLIFTWISIYRKLI